jgi:hypothetical protein
MRLPAFISKGLQWWHFNAAGAVVTALLWGIAEMTGWIKDVAFLGRISMANFIITFVAAFRADR